MKPQYIDAGISEQRSIYIKQIDRPYLDKPFHFHPNCELVYIEEGYGKRIVGDNVANFNEGDLVLMGPDLPHIWMDDSAFYKGDKKFRSKATVVYFAPHLLEKLLNQKAQQSFQLLIRKAKRGLVLRGRTKEAVQQKMIEMNEQEGLPQVIAFLSILDLMMQTKEIRYLSGEKFINHYNEKDTGRINQVYRFLMQNFSRNILLDEVAAIANMAPTAFCRYFKEHTGKTFSGFLNELRIEHACELLLHPDKTISEVCYESGYNNLTNFNKFFKSITGKTPTAYRTQGELV